jgi:acyl-CoA synthetase (AMP-forming)/AMP-acid ligase II
MTEFLPIANATAEEKLANSRGDLLGRPIGDTEVKIAEDNEILVRGSGLMKNYYGQPSPEWHPTGDLGELTDDGRIILLGRKKNMLIRGNKNIYPSLYEPGLTTIPGVADAAIIGAPDGYGDDRVVLFIVPEPGSDPAAVRAAVQRDVIYHVDADALPDRIEVIPVMPVSGRANKRNQAELSRLAGLLFPDSPSESEQ